MMTQSTFMHRTRVLWCAAAICLLGATLASVAAQPMRFDRLAKEAGLSQTTVLAMLQDSQGFLWFGTEDGLNRFDGYTFKVYKHDPADPASIPSDFVFALAEGPTGDLWIGTDGGGVARLERATDRFHRIDSPSPYVRALRFDASGQLWIGTRDEGLARLDPASGEQVRFGHDPADAASLSDDRIYVLAHDRDGRLLVGTGAGLNRLDAEANSFSRFVHEPGNPASLSDGRVRTIFEDTAGQLWVGTYGGGLNRLDTGTERFARFRHDPRDPSSLSHDRVRAIFEDADGRLWVGTSAGLNLLRADGRSFVRYGHDAADANSLSDDHVMAIAQDRGGVLWVGTRSGGVNKWNPLTWQFGHHLADPSDPHGLSSPHVSAFSEDAAGNLWIGTFGGGLHVMDRASGKMSRYVHRSDDRASLSSDRVMTLLHDHRGTLWVGTLDGGLNRFESRSGTFRVFRHDPDRPRSVGADGVMSLLEDSRGTLWVGTFGGGLNRFDASAGTFRRFAHDPDDATSLGGNRVTSLAEDTEGFLWVGTDGGGLSRFDPRTGQARQFHHDADDPSSLASDVVYSVFVDPAGQLWVGTRDGLSQLVAETSFRTFTERHGLPNDAIYGVRADLSGQLWLSTNHGLSRFDPRTETFRNFDASDGLQSNEFNFGAAFHNAAGELFFGGVNGFNAFSPETLQVNEHTPPVVLTGFYKSNRPVETAVPVEALRKMELGYRDDVVTFEFAALDFAAPERNRYRYMLEGFDDEWIDLGNRRRVTYTDLDGGRYVLRVQAANGDGVWSDGELALELAVAAPPWKTRWAYGFYTLSVLGCVFGFVRVQQRKLAREEAYAERLELDVRQRTHELADRAEELESLNQRLVRTSVTDALTGLANRRFLLQYLEKEVALLHRRYAQLESGTLTQERLDLAFLMIDLDNFKTINDTCGHEAGDRVLTQLKEILENACRGSDILIRWGGDEFLVVGRDSDFDGLACLAERIRSRIADHAFDIGEGRVVHTTCSVGFACYPFVRSELEALSWEQVISIADRALYAAKASGRDAWVGLASTESTGTSGLLGAVRNDTERMAAEGRLAVRTSLGADREICWE